MGKKVKDIVVLVGEDDSQFYFKGYDKDGNILTTTNKDEAKKYDRFYWSERQCNESKRQGFKTICIVPETSDCPIGTGEEMHRYNEEVERQEREYLESRKVTRLFDRELSKPIYL